MTQKRYNTSRGVFVYSDEAARKLGLTEKDVVGAENVTLTGRGTLSVPTTGIAATPSVEESAAAKAGGETDLAATTDAGTADAEPTKDELMEQAKDLDVEGRSTMNKAELAEAVEEAETDTTKTTAQNKKRTTK